MWLVSLTSSRFRFAESDRLAEAGCTGGLSTDAMLSLMAGMPGVLS